MTIHSQTAFLFPGQGSQFVGMLSAEFSSSACIKKIFSRASDVLHYDLWDLVKNGPAEKLDQTEYTQPALLAANVALWEDWCDKNTEKPAFLAGHSLGEYAALVCAESIIFEDAILLVSQRGHYMQSAVAPGSGAMAAIVGLSDDTVATVCEKSGGIVSPANYNSIGQVVIAGETCAVEKAILIAREAGAKIAKKIPVSVPSHCVLMQSAADQMAQVLKSIRIKIPLIPVIHNVDAVFYHSSEKIRDALVRQLTSPVRWVETIQYLISQGVTQFYECGPGSVLCGLNKRISRDTICRSLVD